MGARGKYNEDHIGHEAYNFKDVDGKVYGYFQPYSRKTIAFEDVTLNLERISPGHADRTSLAGVLVVFVATHPEEGEQRLRNYREYGKGRGWTRA